MVDNCIIPSDYDEKSLTFVGTRNNTFFAISNQLSNVHVVLPDYGAEGLKTCHSILDFYKNKWSLAYEDVREKVDD